MSRTLAAALLFSVRLAAQLPPACKPPPELQSDLSANPSAEAWSAAGYAFIEKQQPKCAIAAFGAAVKLNPNLLEARYNLGLALADSGDAAGSMEELRAAVRLQPGDPNIRAALAASLHTRATELLRSVAQRAEAEKLLRESIALDPGSTGPVLALALSLVDQQRHTESTHVLHKALEAQPDQPALLNALGMTLVRMRQLDEAVRVFRRVVKLQPQSAENHVNLGVALADLSNQAEALASFDEAVRLAPQLAAARHYRGRALHELHRDEEAKPELEAALRLKPGFGPAMFALGATLNSLGEHGPASLVLAKVLVAAPSDGKAHFELGQALAALDREDEALVHFRKASELEPADAQAAFALLQILRARQSPEASALAERVRLLKKNELAATQARVLSNFGLDAANERDWPKAAGKLREALDACGTCQIRPVLQKNLGLILARSGDITGARRELEVARRMDPKDRDIQYALDLLPK